MVGVTSSAATSSDSVELHMLSFCLMEEVMGILPPRLRHPPVCPRQSRWDAWDPSTYQRNTDMSLGRMMRGSSKVPLKYLTRCISLFQSSTSGPLTLVVRKATAVAMLGLAHLVRYKLLATKLWKTEACCSFKGTASGSTVKRFSDAGVMAVLSEGSCTLKEVTSS